MYPPSRVATDRPSPVGLIIYCPVERDIIQRLLPHRRQNTLDVSPITGQPSVSVRRLCVEPREYDECYESTHPRWTQHKYITWNCYYSVSSSSASARGPWVCPEMIIGGVMGDSGSPTDWWQFIDSGVASGQRVGTRPGDRAKHIIHV